jgi:hypothetical protein
MTAVNDIVLIYFEDHPLVFARIEDISPDIKKNWYHVRLLLLQIPVETVTWILKGEYIDGREYTMGGKRMRLERIVAPKETAPPQDDGGTQEKDDAGRDTKTGSQKIIPLSTRKPKT